VIITYKHYKKINQTMLITNVILKEVAAGLILANIRHYTACSQTVALLTPQF